MDWLVINEINQLDDLVEASCSQPLIIYKHSTRCHISARVKDRLEQEWAEDLHLKAYYLDLLNYRSVSDEIAARFGVAHESPQLLLLKNGRITYHSSHSDILVSELLRQLNA